MTIDQAIKRMESRVEGEFYDGDPENLDDMKLGIEALKFYKQIRTPPYISTKFPLHGETEE
ncbi:MAG: hypothetical protein Q7T57_06680 [Dehalococcoidales bacterium]|nr:hypothetical protein [Dehalococcoidales bacterium]